MFIGVLEVFTSVYKGLKIQNVYVVGAAVPEGTCHIKFEKIEGNEEINKMTINSPFFLVFMVNYGQLLQAKHF